MTSEAPTAAATAATRRSPEPPSTGRELPLTAKVSASTTTTSTTTAAAVERLPSSLSPLTSPPPGSTSPISPIRAALRGFSSQWFLIPQGTGITAVILHQLEYQFRGLQVISYIVWGLAAVSLILTVLLYAVRLALYPKHVAAAIASNPGEAACYSSVSIAFTSVIQMLALTLSGRGGGGGGWTHTVCGMWWANLVLALAATIVIPYLFAHVHPPGAANFPPVTQLPLVAAITLAAGGGVVAQSIALSTDGGDVATAQLAAPIVLVSYLFLGIGLPLALLLSTVYLLRLFDGAPPPAEKVYQEMILCGPWGQGSFALQSLGQVLVQQAPAFHDLAGSAVLFSTSATSAIGYTSMFAGFLSWGQGTFWWLLAVVSVVHSHLDSRKRQSVERIQYTLTAWSLVFPWGVYTNAAVQLGKLLDSAAFRVWSTVLAIMLVIILLTNLVFTIRGIWNGSLLQRGDSRVRYEGSPVSLKLPQ